MNKPDGTFRRWYGLKLSRRLHQSSERIENPGDGLIVGIELLRQAFIEGCELCRQLLIRGQQSTR